MSSCVHPHFSRPVNRNSCCGRGDISERYGRSFTSPCVTSLKCCIQTNLAAAFGISSLLPFATPTNSLSAFQTPFLSFSSSQAFPTTTPSSGISKEKQKFRVNAINSSSENNESDVNYSDETRTRKRRSSVLPIKQKSDWQQEEKAYRFYNGEKYYIDELDILGILENHIYYRPLDPSSYNPAEYLWNKFDDIPPERRVRLLNILESRHLTKLWDLSVYKYQTFEDLESYQSIPFDANFFLPDSIKNDALKPQIWEGLVFGLPPPFQFLQRFKKAFFIGNDGFRYGRVISGGPYLESLSNEITPLYFSVKTEKEVLISGEKCEASFRYGDGQLQLKETGVPENFPSPKPHPWLFNDGMCDYVRAIGPNVLIGQTWQEGKSRQQTPKKFLKEFILIKRTTSENLE